MISVVRRQTAPQKNDFGGRMRTRTCGREQEKKKTMQPDTVVRSPLIVLSHQHPRILQFARLSVIVGSSDGFIPDCLVTPS